MPITVKLQGQEGANSIPVQGIRDFPLSSIDFEDPFLHFEMSIQNQQLIFDGVLEQGKVIGCFTQQGPSFPFELNKALETAKEEE